MSKKSDYKREDYRKEDYRRDDYRRSDYRKGSTAYRERDREEDDGDSRVRDRSPHRTHDRYESTEGSFKKPDKQKLAFGFEKKNTTSDSKKTGIQLKLASGSTSSKFTTPAPTKKHSVASVFNNDDDDDEPEEMPAEARMRMRNIGRDTPTSAGPNSFGKTKQGFCDSKKIFEKALKRAMDESNE